jgi:hypothetical protein
MRRPRSSAAWIDPTGAPDEDAWSAPTSNDGLRVADDFGAIVPVGPRELEIIDTYLGALLDTLLRGPG